MADTEGALSVDEQEPKEEGVQGVQGVAEKDEKGEMEIIVKELKKKTPTGKRANLSEEAKENARLNLQKAAANKAHYKKVRQDLGLGARDPIPEKYKLPTKTYAPLKYAENKKKEIVDANENVAELKKESAAAKVKKTQDAALGIKPSMSAKSAREKELSRQVKEANLARLVRNEINDAMFQRSALKAQMKAQEKADNEAAKKEMMEQEQIQREKVSASNKRKVTRMRLSDGRIIEV